MSGRILDKLFKDEDKKNFIDNLKKEAEAQKSLEDIDKLLHNKYWEIFLDDLKKKWHIYIPSSVFNYFLLRTRIESKL